METLLTAYCKDCIYRERQHNMCCYFDMAGTLRGCPPGDGCTKRVTGKKTKMSICVSHRSIPTAAKLGRPKKTVTKEQARDQERLRLYRLGTCDSDIAAEMNCRKEEITKWRQTMGLRATFKDSERLRRYLAGMSDEEIAELEGLTVKAVANWRRRHGLHMNRW